MTDISDHLPIPTVIESSAYISDRKEPLLFKGRKVNNDSIPTIQTSLADVDWTDILNLNTNVAFETSQDKLLLVLANCAGKRYQSSTQKSYT